MNEEYIKSELEKIEKQKEKMVSLLMDMMKSGTPSNFINEIGFTLVDNFRDERIEQYLVELIKKPCLKNCNGSLLHLLGNYTTNRKYLYFLIDLILQNEDNGEIIMDGYSMIINMQPPLERTEMAKSIQRLRREEKKKNNSALKKKLIRSLINFLEGQRDVYKFYSQFKCKEDM